MRIAFFLGWPGISGGTNVIYEHASGLQQLGHQVTLVTQTTVAAGEASWHPRAGSLEWLTLEAAQRNSFDIVIATWWESPFLLHHLNARHSVYFVQSIESRFWPPDDPADHNQRTNSLGKALSESSYTLNVAMITEARWIRDYLHTHYNHWPCLVQNGISKEIFTAQGPVLATRTGQLRVLVEGPVDVFHKNVPKTVELCRRAGIQEVWLLTASEISSYPGVDRVFSGVPIAETAAIYRSCDLLVKLSYIEGMFGPPLEMFHCGGTALVYDVTGHDEYIVHDQNGYVVQRDDEEDVVRCLQHLNQHRDDLDRLKQGAAVTARQWPDWQQATARFSDALDAVAERPPDKHIYLKTWAERMHHEHAVRMGQQELARFQRREQGTAHHEDRHNFIQVYYRTDNEPFQTDNMRWAHYPSGEQTRVQITVPVSGVPLLLRIDPGITMGGFVINTLTVTEKGSGRQLLTCATRKEFTVLTVAGTAKSIALDHDLALFSYGNDPQILLPLLNDLIKGDELIITLQLNDCSLVDFIAILKKGSPVQPLLRALSALCRLPRRK
jgi:O-antigen biosynthesis protein